MIPGTIAARLGARARGFQPLRSLLAAGIPVALGSDGPQNPFLNILFATIHPGHPGVDVPPARGMGESPGREVRGSLSDRRVRLSDVYVDHRDQCVWVGIFY